MLYVRFLKPGLFQNPGRGFLQNLLIKIRHHHSDLFAVYSCSWSVSFLARGSCAPTLSSLFLFGKEQNNGCLGETPEMGKKAATSPKWIQSLCDSQDPDILDIKRVGRGPKSSGCLGRSYHAESYKILLIGLRRL